MVPFLREHSKTNIEMNFISCLDFDYASTDYDMVLYSPPYYNIERYTGQSSKSRTEWNQFYKILCDLSWRHLQRGGWYCVNVSNEIYDIYKASLGRCADIVIPMPNHRRSVYNLYSESVFCWNK